MCVIHWLEDSVLCPYNGDEEQSSTRHAKYTRSDEGSTSYADGERSRRGMMGERLAFLKRSLEGDGVVKVNAE